MSLTISQLINLCLPKQIDIVTVVALEYIWPCLTGYRELHSIARLDITYEQAVARMRMRRNFWAAASLRPIAELSVCAEADVLLGALNVLMEKGVALMEIKVLTFYTAQRNLLQKKLAQAGLATVEACTIDAFQGRQSRVILLSLVRSKVKAFIPTYWQVSPFLACEKQKHRSDITISFMLTTSLCVLIVHTNAVARQTSSYRRGLEMAYNV